MAPLKHASIQAHHLTGFVVAVALAAFAGSIRGQELNVPLSGSQEIPPVTTSASGFGTISVGADRAISVRVIVSGLTVTVAHIHEASAGANGPIIVPLIKTADGVWIAPAGAKLTEAQYESYKAGNLYFNIHTDAHKAGEIRGQIRP